MDIANRLQEHRVPLTGVVWRCFPAQNSPLHQAASEGRFDVIRRLLTEGAPPDSLDYVSPNHMTWSSHFNVQSDGLSADWLHCLQHPSPIIKALKLIIFRLQSGRTPLHVAALAGQIECVDFLIAAGANPNAETVRADRMPQALRYALCAWVLHTYIVFLRTEAEAAVGWETAEKGCPRRPGA